MTIPSWDLDTVQRLHAVINSMRSHLYDLQSRFSTIQESIEATDAVFATMYESQENAVFVDEGREDYYRPTEDKVDWKKEGF